MAATFYVSSGVVKDQNGNPRPGVILDDCRGNQRTTNASGYFQFSYPHATQYCIRAVLNPLPNYVTNPVAINRRAGGATTSYDWQIAGEDCYQRLDKC